MQMQTKNYTFYKRTPITKQTYRTRIIRFLNLSLFLLNRNSKGLASNESALACLTSLKKYFLFNGRSWKVAAALSQRIFIWLISAACNGAITVNYLSVLKFFTGPTGKTGTTILTGSNGSRSWIILNLAFFHNQQILLIWSLKVT